MPSHRYFVTRATMCPIMMCPLSSLLSLLYSGIWHMYILILYHSHRGCWCMWSMLTSTSSCSPNACRDCMHTMTAKCTTGNNPATATASTKNTTMISNYWHTTRQSTISLHSLSTMSPSTQMHITYSLSLRQYTVYYAAIKGYGLRISCASL